MGSLMRPRLNRVCVLINEAIACPNRRGAMEIHKHAVSYMFPIVQPYLPYPRVVACVDYHLAAVSADV